VRDNNHRDRKYPIMTGKIGAMRKCRQISEAG
jgi:hypothetical protein